MMVLAIPLAARAEEKPGKAEPTRELVITPQGGKAWEADEDDVRAVLRSSAKELWKHFPDRKLEPILVQPKGGPIVFFKRGPKGEYQVKLNTGGNYWSQYAYQFAHEFCHILCGFREGDAANKWFEESLCELASLYALRAMSKTWETKPPYANWKEYAPRHNEYAEERIKAAALPEGKTLAQWYAANAEQLKKDATQRELNGVVATALLPLLEKSPEHWAAVGYVNTAEYKEGRTFEQYLKDWHASVPEKHRGFVKEVAGKLGFKIE
jgi:hypothetical protein